MEKKIHILFRMRIDMTIIVIIFRGRPISRRAIHRLRFLIAFFPFKFRFKLDEIDE